MIDISVKDLVKSFDEDGNLLDGISFDVQSCIMRLLLRPTYLFVQKA